MNGINVEWAVRQLNSLIEQTELIRDSKSFYGKSTKSREDDIAAQAQIVERILTQVTPHWRHSVPVHEHYPWNQLREAAIRAKSELLHEQELRQNLGDDAPEISAADLHPWIWGGAASLWQSGHFREAVEGAIRKLNAETQNKLGRRDMSETDLFNQAFSEQPPAIGKPRLHRMTNDGNNTFKSVQRGARTFAEGVFAGIRNPLAHESTHEMTEQQALEYLAALSVLARWVDESTVETEP